MAFPSADAASPFSFRCAQLLVNHILPFASRRNPDSIDEHLESPETQALFQYYEKAIFGIFQFYASSDDANRKKKLAQRLRTAGWLRLECMRNRSPMNMALAPSALDSSAAAA